MKKQLFIALTCAASMMFAACNLLGGKGGNGAEGGEGGANMQKKWITEPAQIKDYEPETKVNECWEYKLWCDGVTVATEYIWGPESAVIFMINASMTAEYKKLRRIPQEILVPASRRTDGGCLYLSSVGRR